MEENQSRENPKFGRKVFFLNPPLNFEHHVIQPLRDDEYEIYIIDDYKKAKPMLIENKDALLFINIDGQLSFKQWFNFIFSFRDDEILKSIFVGIVSAKATANDAQYFFMNLTLAGGFILLNNNEIIKDKITKILDLNGAKGNRKYIRLDCRNLSSVSSYFVLDNKLYDLKIENLSSVGFACIFKQELENRFAINSVFDNISLTIGRKTCVCNAVVFRVVNNMAVMLFTKKMTNEGRNDIRNFIHATIIADFKEKMDNAMSDMDEYSNEIDIEAVARANAEKKPEIEFDGDSLFGLLDDIE